MLIVLFIFLSFTSPLFLSKFSISLDTLALNQTLSDNTNGQQTLISAGHKFELGFFGPWNSSYRYVGIWFKNIPEKTLVWVANKDNPLKDPSGVLSITPDGNIVILSNRTKSIIWTSSIINNASFDDTTNPPPVLQLLDTGNLIVKFSNMTTRDYYLWQSFDYPGNTLLPGMKLGWDLKNNKEWYLTSWKSSEEEEEGPSTGAYTYHVDYPRGLPQMVLIRGSEVEYRSGPWDGVRFGGGQPKPNTVFNPIFVYDEYNVYYTYDNVDESIVSRFMVSPSGILQQLKWSITRAEWIVIATVQTDTCDVYDTCGSYGICSVTNSQECWCPDGFAPRYPKDWYRLDWAGGCVRNTALNCSMDTGFKMFSKLKLPDTSSYFMLNITATDCEKACLSNCSCTAYAKTQVSGCVVWFGDLLDMRTYDEGGQDLYIRMPASELAQDGDKKRKVVIVAISVASVVGVLLVCLICCCYIFRKRISKPTAVVKKDFESHHELKSIGDEEFELPSFDLVTISTATDGFSFMNKIGEGGFGPVYKGVLSTGQEIAVKRLSKSSGQGLEEFKNEVILIARLQHRNLVRLLGCCIHDEERMLVYEYMQNRSLDLIIFDETKGGILEWGKRFQIIVGIARGLLYLHRDSRLRIIHRDLKTSNILLDSEMNPKISDFGLARTFGGDEHHDNTNRVMGTFGYMAPEYAIDGLFSVKSDVFSFGVLTLEIVSGKKNRGFCHPDHDLNLLGHAWRLFSEGEPLKLVNACIGSSPPIYEVLRCIHVALLCVQKRSEDRPTMSTVLLMLDSENPVLPPPTLPGFYAERSVVESDSSSTRRKPLGSNEMTVTLLLGR